VIIPAYNEEAGVGPQVEVVREALQAQGVPHEIMVVDDGSADRTGQEALRAGAKVLVHLSNCGYGASLKTGILAARYEKIAIIDADGTYPPDQIAPMLEQLETADMVVGARTGANVNVPWVRRPAKWLLGWLANRVAGRHIPDLNSGLRVFWRDCARQYFAVLSNRFSFTSTITLALLADGYRVVYHPIDYYRRVGKSKIAPWHFVDFVILVFRIAMLFQPLRILVPPVLTLGLLGMVKVCFDVAAAVARHGGLVWAVFAGPVISTSAVVLLLASLHLLLIGMVADGLNRSVARHGAPLLPSRGVVEAEPEFLEDPERVEA
jgi:glycosyltransferase involved in cell wall biosynthesis